MVFSVFSRIATPGLFSVSIGMRDVFHPFTLKFVGVFISKMCFLETIKLDIVLSGLKGTQNRWLTVH